MIRTVFSRFLVCAALLILPIAVPNSARAQDAGIDCHVPRTTLNGRLVLDPEGQSRALCEVDRATALNYTHLLQTVRDQVAQALRELPPPLLGDFIDYLETDERIERWRPKSEDLDLLANTNAALAWSAADRAVWDQGILAASGIDPEVWGIQARACVAAEGQGQVVVWLDPARLRDRVPALPYILTENQPNVFRGWTPAMVQRTTYAWMKAREGLVAIERTPKIIDGPIGAPVTRRIDGNERELDGCFDTPVGRHSALPRGALAMDATLSWRTDTETENIPCTDPIEVGFQRHRRHILRGVSVNDAGQPLLQNGQMVSADNAWDVIRDTCRAPRDVSILDLQDCVATATLAGRPVQGNVIYTYLFRERRDPLDATAVIEHPVNGDGSWTVFGEDHTPQPNPAATFCAAGDYPAPEGPVSDIVGDVPVAECAVAHDGRFNQGIRVGYIRRIVYPADWPVADVEVSWIVDRCFAPVQATDNEHRFRTCPQGQDGRIIEGRAISWYNRTWADRAHNATGDTRTAAQALEAWSADPDQTALEWYDIVSVGDWSLGRNICQHAIVHDPAAPVLGDRPGGGGGVRPSGALITWDVDGDGWGDFETRGEAETYLLRIYQQDPDPDASPPDYDTIEEAFIDCYRCDGPDRGSWVDPESESDDAVSRPRPGGFFGSIGSFFTSIFGGGNNNNNDDNDDNDDNDNQDQGSRPTPATERPPPATERPRPSFWDRLFGRVT